MKQLKTVLTNAEKLSKDKFLEHLTRKKAKDYFSDIVDDKTYNERVSLFEKICVLVCDELATSLNEKNDAFKMILDANYEKEKSKSEDVDLTVFSLLDKDESRAIHYYAKHNKDSIKFSLCLSCHERIRTKVDELEKASLKIKRDKNNKAKTIYRDNVSYEELVDLSKTILSILRDETEK